MAMVQDPKTAAYPRMPESAIATGLADYVLPVEQMPEALIKYVQHYYHQRRGNRRGSRGGPESSEPVAEPCCVRDRSSISAATARKCWAGASSGAWG